MTEATTPCIDIQNLRFAWSAEQLVLDIERFNVRAGEHVFLQGPSGSGKSTLLGLIAGVLPPQTGTLNVLGRSLPALSNTKRDRLRADQVGVIFQQFNLVPYLTVQQNVGLPCRFSQKRAERVKAAGGLEQESARLLEHLGLSEPDLLSRPVTELSVGQQQRVAAARALIGAPALIIADEPTSALDTNMRNRFIALLSREARETGAALLFVSHDIALADQFDRMISLPDINQAISPEVEVSG